MIESMSTKGTFFVLSTYTKPGGMLPSCPPAKNPFDEGEIPQ